MPDPSSAPGQPADSASGEHVQRASSAAGGESPSVVDVVAAVCPFLVAADGAWRAASASREHRCGATAPPGRLTLERQSSLCLLVAHLDCPLFEAATGPTGGSRAQQAVRAAAELDPNVVPATAGETSREAGSRDADAPAFVQVTRANPRTTPVIMDRAKSPLDVHLPQIHLPAVGSRRATPASGRTGAADGEAGARSSEAASPAIASAAAADGAAMRNRLEQLREARTRTRSQDGGATSAARMTTADSGERPEMIPPIGRAGDAPSDGPTPRPGWLARLADVFRSPAQPASTAGYIRRRPADGRPADPDSGADTEPAARRGGPGASPTPGRTGGLWNSVAGIRATMSGRQIQAALAGLMALALVLVLVVRFSGGGGTTGVAGASSSARPSAPPSAAQSGGIPSPALSSGATGSAVASVEPNTSQAPSRSVAPSTAAPTAKATPQPTKSPAAVRTYRVKSGDTLSAIAARFKTTVAVLMRLNKIADARTLRIGQVLKLP